MIKKEGGKWVLVSKHTGKVLGRHPSRQDAMMQEKAIQLSKLRKQSHSIPKKQ